ncbi:MAG: arabinogalactan oligomer / maltooligosaccharide transport system permease protein [Bacillota bacterium]|nr:arabinogalactan oligomer / maltooligosaccharide transport system permease protein [Bacillota bacterium]
MPGTPGAPRRPGGSGKTEFPSGTLAGALAKILLLGPLNAVAVWAAVILAGERLYWLLALLVVGCGLIDYVFLARRAYPWRYLVPGLFFMAVMVVYPLCYTVLVAFTNYGTGHILSKDMAIQHYTSRYVLKEDLPQYSAAIFRDDAGRFAVLLTDSAGQRLVGVKDKVVPLEDAGLEPVDEDGDGVLDRIGDFRAVPTLAVFKYLSDLQKLEFHVGGDGGGNGGNGGGDSDSDSDDNVLKMRTPTSFATYSPEFRYDKDRDALVDVERETVYYARDGSFVADSGEALDTGYKAKVGWRNFRNLVRNPQISGPFFRVFVWTFVWAALSVLTTFSLGLLLAVILNDAKMKFRTFYRVVLILPYAMPAFISALIWRGLLNTEVGLVNSVLKSIIGVGVPWLQDPLWAKVALIIVNLWLGFPYMMLVCLGALQSIPHELYEASTVDGATGWQQFWRITLPLLLVSVAPLLISSFAFNFNNFNVVYLVTKGRPAIPGAQTPAGATDILISYTYRLAFESAAGTDYGLAAAVTMIIFLIVGTLSWINFRFTGALEEVRENA